ncbi:hypothetical protein A3K82_02485 [Candidatus Pacearchaeota archaeon RBG_19FT_COMBO_34_9]|nr:MAG: hypothetical protein A3K82_02485 [Candidatus Pacearchaeota archaeon RBG_19FT_COMBO_34_9]OGJ16680.1 MAG: hypothetical protein A3K74_00495 [Candidatus Pacearchaeota archaeon RBG_13_33_26]
MKKNLKSAVLSVINGSNKFPKKLTAEILFPRSDPTSDSRKAHFPGEIRIVHYYFEEKGTVYCGWLGFGKDWELIDIDERLPKKQERYFSQNKNPIFPSVK